MAPGWKKFFVSVVSQTNFTWWEIQLLSEIHNLLLVSKKVTCTDSYHAASVFLAALGKH